MGAHRIKGKSACEYFRARGKEIDSWRIICKMEQPKRQLQDYFEGHFSLFSPPEGNSIMYVLWVLAEEFWATININEHEGKWQCHLLQVVMLFSELHESSPNSLPTFRRYLLLSMSVLWGIYCTYVWSSEFHIHPIETNWTFLRESVRLSHTQVGTYMYFTKTYPFLTSGRPCHFELNLYESFPLGLKEKKMIFFCVHPED